MIELKDNKGKQIFINKNNIKSVEKYFAVKKYSSRTLIVLNSGEKIYSCMSIREINKIINPL